MNWAPIVRDNYERRCQAGHEVLELLILNRGQKRRPHGCEDGRVVRLELTEEGDRVVNDLTHVHLAEMHKLAAVLNMLVTGEYLAHPGIRGPARSSD